MTGFDYLPILPLLILILAGMAIMQAGRLP